MSSAATAAVVLREGRICFVRGQKVMLDVDLSDLHQISKKALRAAVRRNRSRFPHDFMFELTAAETESLELLPTRRVARVLPYAFTEMGLAMVASLLRSKKAIELSVDIIRELGRNADGSLFQLITDTFEPKKKRIGLSMPTAAAVNEY